MLAVTTCRGCLKPLPCQSCILPCEDHPGVDCKCKIPCPKCLTLFAQQSTWAKTFSNINRHMILTCGQPTPSKRKRNDSKSEPAPQPQKVRLNFGDNIPIKKVVPTAPKETIKQQFSFNQQGVANVKKLH